MRVLSILALLIGATAQAQPVQLEHDAIVGNSIASQSAEKRMELLNALANMIRLNGWRCDSISAARTMLFSRGYAVSCNGYAYSYEIEDRGGQWVVSLD